MFFILSKTIYWLILPFSQVLIVLAIYIFSTHQKIKEISKWVFLGLLLWYSSPITSSLALKIWEVPAYSFEEIDEDYDIGIVLSGMAHMRSEPTDRIHFSESVDRIIDAISLYKQQKIKKILISGGSGNILHPELKEAYQLRDFCISMGVQASNVIIEPDSRNTHENARNSMEIIKNQFPQSNYVLITSASHMRRAKACFKKQGGNPAIFSTDINTTPFEWDFRLLIPNVDAIRTWSTVIRETTGYTVYWLAGYI